MNHENGPAPRCPECNHKAPAHSDHCRAGIDDSRPMTSAERYADLHLPNHEQEQHRAAYAPRERYFSDGDVCGSASPVDAYPPHVQVGEPAVRRYCPAHDIFHLGYDCPEDHTPPGPKPMPPALRAELEEQGFGDLLEAPTALPTNALARKELPMATGLLDYFPGALVAIAALSRVGNEQHNPGKPLHWDRSKSGDEADALFRHLVERGTIDTDGLRHSTKVAWRALALLQKELEEAGLCPISRGSI